MGGSNAATTTKIDATIGTIVWVRRRNGSWWPGRILGPDELSATHLMSPRSGTPVKLLGRDDASVDWYNIEKSKRVKAFRCGEYDDCIERAKAYANLPAKKVVKYARREDAILHALELEKNQLQKEQSSCLEVVCMDEKKCGSVAKQSQIHAIGPSKDEHDHKPKDCSECLEPDSPLDAVQSVVSFQQTNTESAAGSLLLQKVKQTNEADWEDDGNEGTTRMRGLQDFGLRIAPKRKPNIGMPCEGIPKVVIPKNGVCSESYIGQSMGCASPVNGSKACSLTLKRKRSQIRPVQESFVKRRDRRRPLTKVLESSAKLAVPSFSDYYCSAIESVHKGVMESGVGVLQSKQMKKAGLSTLPSNSSDCTGTSFEREISLQASQHAYETTDGHYHSVSVLTDNACSNLLEHMDANCCEKGYVHPDIHAEETTFTDFSQVFSSSTSKKFRTSMVGRRASLVTQSQAGLMSKEGLDETGFSICSHQPDAVEQSMGVVTDQGVSKWQSKGKRNARPLNKKYCESSNGRSFTETDDTCTAPMYAMTFEDKLYSSKEPRTKKVIYKTYEESVSFEKHEHQLSRCFYPDDPLRDCPGQNSMPVSVDGRHVRTGHTSLRTKGEMKHLDCQKKIDLCIMERNEGPFSNDKCQALSLSDEKNNLQDSSLSDEKVLTNKWMDHADTQQELWQQKFSIIEGLDTGTSSGMISSNIKSLGETQLIVPDAPMAPKLPVPVAQDSRLSMLFEVPLDIQTSYHQGERVPLVSLMSRLNGKAIVGHPVTVEALEDGYSDIFLGNNNFMTDLIVKFQSHDTDKVRKRVVPPPWRTARRTDMHHIPRCCPATKINEGCNLSQLSARKIGQSMVKAGYSVPFKHKGRYVRKNARHMRGSSLDKKLPKKFLKRAGLTSKKTRTLSSIVVEHESKYENCGFQRLKLAEAPLVTCIPVKLVFSRIREAVGNSSKMVSCGLSSSGSGE